jgi:hypothetical protein
MPKNYKQVKRKIRKLSKNEEQKDNLVIQKGDTYYIYNEYKIIRDKHKFNIYIEDSNQFVNTVYNSSSAIAWCNAHKGNHIDLARDIISTDRSIEFLTNDIASTKILIKLKSTPHVEQGVLLARLVEYASKQLRLKLNLHKYIQRSNQIKSKGFLNEFTAPNQAKNLNRVR